MQWHDLWAAFALYLVLEGLVPFANPAGMRRALAVLSRLDDRTLRIGGLLSMIAGALLLFVARGGA
jgi:uncharacterized protein YjeT (DUF2065 family)